MFSSSSFFGESSSHVDENEPLCAIKVAPLCSVISRGILNEWRNGSQLLAGRHEEITEVAQVLCQHLFDRHCTEYISGALDVCGFFFSFFIHTTFIPSSVLKSGSAVCFTTFTGCNGNVLKTQTTKKWPHERQKQTKKKYK